MMKKRGFCSLFLALALVCSLCTPVFAAEGADARLAQVTLAVKRIIEVEDDFTEFYGEPSETPLGTRWSLSWQGEDKYLSVSATETGKILNYRRYNYNYSSVVSNDNGAHFPAMTQARALELAKAFLERVLEDNETVVFDPVSIPYLGTTQYAFSGRILLNGIQSPLRFSVTVDIAQGDVTYFRRDDQSSYVGQVPAPDTVTTAEAARAQLAGTLEFELIYVKDYDADQAVLRYVSRYGHNYYVDAATGELIDLTALQSMLSGTTGADNKYFVTEDAGNDLLQAAPEAAPAPTLTPTELEGVAKLEGVLTQEELGEKVKAWDELILEDFEVTGCFYSVEREPVITEDGAAPAEKADDVPAKVTARLTLTKRTDDGWARRYFTVDARTGEMANLSGYNPYRNEPAKLDQETAQAKAEAFLAKLWPDQFAQTELYSSYTTDKIGGSFGFTYAQKVNGYFFPANTISVQVSAEDGAITGFSKYYDDTVVFDSAEGIIGKAAAQTAWAASYPVELTYLSVPVALDPAEPEVKPLIAAGYSYYSALKPGYAWGERKGWYSAVDAKTGELVGQPYTAEEPMAYDDLEGHWSKAALEELALYGIGWKGGKAQPDASLSQLDYIAFLASVNGYRYDPATNADSLYSYAIRQGILTEEEREDDKELTRSDMIAMFLNFLGYRFVANLPGIFRCDFTDADTIPASHMGYAALAQGLKLVQGDDTGAYAPGRAATRAEAATMLWRYLSR